MGCPFRSRSLKSDDIRRKVRTRSDTGEGWERPSEFSARAKKTYLKEVRSLARIFKVDMYRDLVIMGATGAWHS